MPTIPRNSERLVEHIAQLDKVHEAFSVRIREYGIALDVGRLERARSHFDGLMSRADDLAQQSSRRVPDAPDLPADGRKSRISGVSRQGTRRN